MTYGELPTNFKSLEILFLCTLFLYPFTAANHNLYLIPQLLLLGLGVIQLPQSATPNATFMKVAVCFLAIVSCSMAILREAVADESQFLEPVKLLINLSTVLLFIFLGPVFDASICAKWLKRFGTVWLLVTLFSYLHNNTSTWQLLMTLLGPEGVTSSHLYEIAEPLATVFLTKNITAMYLVAIFGAFLYFRRCAGNPATRMEKVLFFVLITLLFSRQGILSGILLIALDSLLGLKRRAGRWSILVIVVAVLVVGAFFAFAFDLNSPGDGATTRLELWRFFFSHWSHFVGVGLGVQGLNSSLEHLNIDNYHMFFMNQIAAYGIVHCLAFNMLLTIIALWSLPKRIRWLVIAPYWLNVCFQTYGYEYGNLFLLCIAANSWNANLISRPQYRVDFPKPLESSR